MKASEYYRDAGEAGPEAVRTPRCRVSLCPVRGLPGVEKPLRRKSFIQRYLDSKQQPMREFA